MFLFYLFIYFFIEQYFFSTMDAMTEAGNLESEALKRKKRLEALRQLKEQQSQSAGNDLQEHQQESLPRYWITKTHFPAGGERENASFHV